MVIEIICRNAVETDVEALFALIDRYAQQGIMLYRSKEALRNQINSFVVAETNEHELIGCGSLTQLGPDLVEIRSLGISDGYKGQGIGTKLVDALVENAREQRIVKVMALTYEVAFFLKNGFRIEPKEIFPEKVWTDCVNCKKQFCCDEIAVLKRLDIEAS
ncbi:N-acetyltransferase [Paenibacillus albiflavus]|uniref:N-acetyltransferase n=1 Tax=Paenibacillus albiflavus TaxID=2545760 RepID=A0A4R4EFZ0_9BACL|nr:N-acetyltransferase [Paenibacillus albiflavus]TCZ77028.1 N-acetyltransferase [Paenibacillus albiflavus]